MASDIPVFLRPIEIVTGTNAVFAIDGNAKTIPNGVYDSVLTVANAMETLLQTITATLTVHVTSDFNIKIFDDDDPGANFNISWTDGDLKTLLGYTGVLLAGAKTYTATYIPEHCWLPSHAPSNQDKLTCNMSSAVVGKHTKSGIWSGIGSGMSPYERDFDFGYQLAANAAARFATNDYDKARCFETFAYGALTARPSVEGNPRCNGFYYVPDHTSYIDTELPDTMSTRNGVDIDYSATPDLHVYGTFADVPRLPSAASLPVGRQYYPVSFRFRTAARDGDWR